MVEEETKKGRKKTRKNEENTKNRRKINKETKRRKDNMKKIACDLMK